MNINSYADGNLSCCVNTGVLKFMSVVRSSHYPIITHYKPNDCFVRTGQVWCTLNKIR